MKKISSWASGHGSAARIIIVLLHLGLYLLATRLAHLLELKGIYLEQGFLTIILFLFIAASAICLSLPKDSISFPKNWQYIIRKSCHFIAACCSFGIFCFYCIHPLPRNEVQAFVTPADTSISKKSSPSDIKEILSKRDKSTLTKTEKKILKKEFKKQLRLYTQAKRQGDTSRADRNGEIILIILLAVGLLLLLAGLACSVSCGGAETLAAIIYLAGLAGIAVLTVFLIKRAKRKKIEPATARLHH